MYRRLRWDLMAGRKREVRNGPWLTSAEAASRLGVHRATLYAYVSRSLIRSSHSPDDPRARRYSSEDVESMRRRGEQRRDPGKIAGRALHWGMPLLESSITLIDGSGLYYRGWSVEDLARNRSVEQVAALIWTGGFDTAVFATTPLHVVSGTRSTDPLPFCNRAQAMLPIVAARDPLAFDLRPRAVAQTGWRILNLLASISVASSRLELTLEDTLRQSWSPRNPHAAPLLRAALILCADHELNVSAFVSRCVASAGSNPYSCVVAGISAIEGAKHGGVTERVATMLDAHRKSTRLQRDLADRLRRGEPIHGFGHPLYPNGDPRARLLLAMLEESVPKSPEVRFASAFSAIAEELTGDLPTIDFALVVLARALKLERGAPLTIFTIGRSIGWIGHAIEQYALDQIIRPRATYVGPEARGE